jgi:TRAP-type C4-dicarboxylate transport system substrate-binding protein
LAAQKLGANVVVISASEIQNSLLRGTVDGIITTALYGRRTGLTDLCTYVNFWPIGSGYPTTLAMNAKKFNSLPPDLQKVMKDVSTEIGRMETFAIALEHMSAMTAIGTSKTQIIEPSKTEYEKAVKLLAPVVGEWSKMAGPLAPKVLEIASDVVSKYRAVWDK